MNDYVDSNKSTEGENIINSIEVMSMIEKEIKNISSRNNMSIKRHSLTYDCKFIYPGETFTDIYTGKDILNSDLKNRLEFNKSGLFLNDLNADDVYVRAGQFSNYTKKFLVDKSILKEKKFVEANTYSKSLKLGFRLKPLTEEKRPVSYIKVLDCLEHLKTALQNVSKLPSEAGTLITPRTTTKQDIDASIPASSSSSKATLRSVGKKSSRSSDTFLSKTKTTAESLNLPSYTPRCQEPSASGTQSNDEKKDADLFFPSKQMKMSDDQTLYAIFESECCSSEPDDVYSYSNDQVSNLDLGFLNAELFQY